MCHPSLPAALLVFEDADIEKAVEWTMFGIFWTVGQVGGWVGGWRRSVDGGEWVRVREPRQRCTCMLFRRSSSLLM